MRTRLVGLGRWDAPIGSLAIGVLLPILFGCYRCKFRMRSLGEIGGLSRGEGRSHLPGISPGISLMLAKSTTVWL